MPSDKKEWHYFSLTQHIYGMKKPHSIVLNDLVEVERCIKTMEEHRDFYSQVSNKEK